MESGYVHRRFSVLLQVGVLTSDYDVGRGNAGQHVMFVKFIIERRWHYGMRRFHMVLQNSADSD